MHEISALVTRSVLDMCSAAGIPVGAHVVDLGFDADSIRRLRRVRWVDHCTLLERLGVAVGGADKLETMVAESFHTALPSELQAVLGATVSPQRLYRFFFQTMTPSLFPGHALVVRELGDGRLSISARLVNNARPCVTFFQVSVGVVRGVTAHLGLPLAEVDIVEITGGSMIVNVRPPPSRTLVARARRTSVRALRQAALSVMELLGSESQATGARAVEAASQIANIGALGRELAEITDLPTLASAMFSMLDKLGWTAAELRVVSLSPDEPDWVARHGDRATTSSYSLRRADFEVGRLRVGGTGDSGLLAEIVPWLGIAVDHARRSSVRRDQPRVDDVMHALDLTKRQGEVLRCVVDGLSNKEIAVALDCSEATVEFHLTHLLRKAAAHSRTQLIARFWAGALSR